MTERRFGPGDLPAIQNAQYRSVPGRKGPGDLRLEWSFDGGRTWSAPSLKHVALIVDFTADNENVLYPEPAQGSGKVFAFVRTTLRDGWEAACAELDEERERARRRRGRTDAG